MVDVENSNDNGEAEVKKFWMFLLTAALLLLPGCSWFQGACTKAMPSILQAQVEVEEARLALDQVSHELATINLSPELLAKAIDYTNRAGAALRSIEAMLDVSAGACTTIDVADLFKDFMAIWASIETLFAAGPKKFYVPPPRGVLLARRKAIGI